VEIDESAAVVTGAGSGIGEALAVAFAAAGARVVAGDVDTSGAERTAQRITALGHTGVAVRADASTEGRHPRHGGPGRSPLRFSGHLHGERRGWRAVGIGKFRT
jgi:NAD(P)-dependent dehydrogenase (short-subunit alcohol dehydrogenase family)